MDSGNKNKKISLYPSSQRPYLKILWVADDSHIYVHVEGASLCSKLSPIMLHETGYRFQIYHDPLTQPYHPHNRHNIREADIFNKSFISF